MSRHRFSAPRLLAFACWLLALSSAQSFQAVVDSGFVLLTWDSFPGVDSFVLLRREGRGDFAHLATIAPVTDTVRINTLITPRSEEWNAIWKLLEIAPARINTLPRRFPWGPFKDRDDWERRGPAWRASRDFLAGRFHRIRVVRGLAWADSAVAPGRTYTYSLGPAGARARPLAPDVSVVAGSISLPLPPSGFTADAGDRMAFLYWQEQPGAVGYRLYRANSASGPYTLLSPSSGTIALLTTNPVTMDSLKPARPGFLDTTCTNNTTYHYKVASVNLLGRVGNQGATQSATPRDKTPPQTPSGISLLPAGYGLRLTWPKVAKDIAERSENVTKYRVWRYRSFEASNRDSSSDRIKAGTVAQVADTLWMVSFLDTWPSLKPDSTYWYRLQAEDDAIPAHNLSVRSGPVSGSFKDTVSPGPATKLVIDPYEDSLILSWSKPKDSDLAGFDVYRGICGGESVVVYREFKVWKPYELSQIANIDTPGITRYVDRSLPAGSPICYRYSVKSYDRNQNLAPMRESICGRLRDRTGPLAPVISALKARDRSIQVEWVAPPVQDLYGFIVERSPSEAGPWTRVSPALSLPDPTKLTCESIPPVSKWQDTTWRFIDTSGVKPETTCWYRVRGVDYLGNEGANSATIGTFTYTRGRPPVPTGLKAADAGGLARLSWQPSFDSTWLGFAVFRSRKSTQGFVQVSPLLRTSTFDDPGTVSGETYYYRVQYYARDGNRSEPSQPVTHIAP
ncbi:hypothetical protein FJY69_02300 [candidate division WOR-3 bacterium]|nr:hypothetical protein [candidate division WOR-3 bacterium]